jgi:hypothetical protein
MPSVRTILDIEIIGMEMMVNAIVHPTNLNLEAYNLPDKTNRKVASIIKLSKNPRDDLINISDRPWIINNPIKSNKKRPRLSLSEIKIAYIMMLGMTVTLKKNIMPVSL